MTLKCLTSLALIWHVGAADSVFLLQNLCSSSLITTRLLWYQPSVHSNILRCHCAKQHRVATLRGFPFRTSWCKSLIINLLLFISLLSPAKCKRLRRAASTGEKTTTKKWGNLLFLRHAGSNRLGLHRKYKQREPNRQISVCISIPRLHFQDVKCVAPDWSEALLKQCP